MFVLLTCIQQMESRPSAAGWEVREQKEGKNLIKGQRNGICQRCRNKGYLLDEQATRMRDGDDETEVVQARKRRGGGEKKGG